MVHDHRGRLLILVLFSPYDAQWKIADFGFAMTGASRAYTTSFSRGTPGYRAPELLQDNAVVTRHSDIWALGCIFLELASGDRVFLDDFIVASYMRTRLPFQIPTLHAELDRCLRSYVRNMVFAMLEIDWWKRPSARDVEMVFETLRPYPRRFNSGISIRSLNVRHVQKPVGNAELYIHTFAVTHRPERRWVSYPRDHESWDAAVWKPTW
jgi:serine/threonine protein kinase